MATRAVLSAAYEESSEYALLDGNPRPRWRVKWCYGWLRVLVYRGRSTVSSAAPLHHTNAPPTPPLAERSRHDDEGSCDSTRDRRDEASNRRKAFEQRGRDGGGCAMLLVRSDGTGERVGHHVGLSPDVGEIEAGRLQWCSVSVPFQGRLWFPEFGVCQLVDDLCCRGVMGTTGGRLLVDFS